MNFHLVKKVSIAFCLSLLSSNVFAEGQFEKFVTKRIPKQLHDCHATHVPFDNQGNPTTLGNAFASCAADFSKLFSEFASPRNLEHATVHANRMKNSLVTLQQVITILSQHFNQLAGSLDHKTQTTSATLIKVLTKMHTDLTDITNILATYNGSLSLLDLRALGNSIMQEKWHYLLPEKYYNMGPLEWKDVLEKRYSPTAIR